MPIGPQGTPKLVFITIFHVLDCKEDFQYNEARYLFKSPKIDTSIIKDNCRMQKY